MYKIKFKDGTEKEFESLQRADLRFSDLRNAYLRSSDLRHSDLRFSDLRNADLQEADLSFSDLRNADLQEADLSFSNLRGADLSFSDLGDVKGLHTFSIVPESGSFVVYKKIKDCLIKMRVPTGAKRLNRPGSRKCRVEYAKVLSITALRTGYTRNFIQGGRNPKFIYTKGGMAVPDRFDPDIRLECTNGIHCFITRQEAIDY